MLSVGFLTYATGCTYAGEVVSNTCIQTAIVDVRHETLVQHVRHEQFVQQKPFESNAVKQFFHDALSLRKRTRHKLVLEPCLADT